ncbi:hypothetical protein CN878_04630 [Ochrobactrum sp. 695/2009]|nr:hypothetical protein CN881_04830 [Ochrobactrum sp. 721/2009]PJT17313.1 hypothetical protein CN880_01355 [Ochrobactrum sp. 720/2009]PJT18162.1 hypothetical protein CN879_22990 [Ochrobactrum sp. 715/2009]PJT30662.1 hypothetical protein CN878_04630 [Ochrobactrum sp. 695/2009]PJT34923.1 hypothetical protein CN877_02235 [Ochrobactrum sp. 689/2009]
MNTKPNLDLKSPTLSPDTIGAQDEDAVVSVTVPPYPNMKTGDHIYLDIGLFTSEPYQVTENDVGNSITHLLKREDFSDQDMKPNTTIPISYIVPVESVEGYPAVSNISQVSYLKVSS